MDTETGYIVAAVGKDPSSCYAGFATPLSWPLDREADSLSRELSQKLFQEWMKRPIGSLQASADLGFIQSYAEHCRRLGISCKVFWFAAAAFSKAPEGFVPLGWDDIASADLSYLWADGDYLFLHYNLSDMRLNAHGLFSCKEDAERYASVRRQALSDGAELEHTDHERFFRVYGQQSDTR